MLLLLDLILLAVRMNFVRDSQPFYGETVFGSRNAGTANEAHISEKGPTKTQLVDFVNASLPVAEVEPLAGRTLPHELIYSLGSSLVLSRLCDERLEPERHQGSMHGCARLNEFEKKTAEPKNRQIITQMVFQTRSKAIIQTFTAAKTTVEPKYDSYELISEPSQRQCGAEFRGEPRDDSFNVALNYLLMHCYQDPVPTGLPNSPLSQPDEAITSGFNLYTMERAFDFSYALESLFNAWLEEPDAKSPFPAPLSIYCEKQASLYQIPSSPNPSEYGDFESDISGNGYFEKLRKEQTTPGLTATAKEGIVPSPAPSNSPTEYFSWKPNWSTKSLQFQLTGLITDMYNLFLKGREVLHSSIVQPILEEKSSPGQEGWNSYQPLSSLMLLLNI